MDREEESADDLDEIVESDNVVGGPKDAHRDSKLPLKDDTENEELNDIVVQTDNEDYENLKTRPGGDSGDSEYEMNESNDDEEVRTLGGKRRRSRGSPLSAQKAKEVDTVEEIAEETIHKDHVKRRRGRPRKKESSTKKKDKRTEVQGICFSKDCLDQNCLGTCPPTSVKQVPSILSISALKEKKCHKCDFSSPSPDELKRHITVKHVINFSPVKKKKVTTTKEDKDDFDEIVEEELSVGKLGVQFVENAIEIQKSPRPKIIVPPVKNCRKADADFAVEVARRFVHDAKESDGDEGESAGRGKASARMSGDSKEMMNVLKPSNVISFDGLKEFMCGLCKSPRFACAAFASLTEHYRTKHRRKFSERSFSPRLFKQHVEKLQRDKSGRYICTYCPWDKPTKKLKSRELMWRHRKKAHGLAWYNCSLCPAKVYNVPQRILMHLNLGHPGAKNIPDLQAPCCEEKVPHDSIEEHVLKCLSGKLEESIKSKSTHYMSIKSKKRFCQFCGLYVEPRQRSKKNEITPMTKHLRTVHAAGKKYQCPFKCEKDEPNVAKLRHPEMIVDHVKKEHSGDINTLDALCPWCQDMVSLQDLMQHSILCLNDIRKLKGKAFRLMCPFCNEDVPYNSTHLKGHFPDSEKSLLEMKTRKCHICDHEFPSVGRMMNHLRRVHSYYRCKCKYCLFSCGLPQELVNHHMNKHDDREAYLFCAGCSDRVPVDEYVSHCADCFKNAMSGQYSEWKSRMVLPIGNARKKLKRREKSGLCERCGLARSDCGHKSQALPSSEKETKLKQAEVPSLCPTCGSSYKNPSAMKFHMKTAHGNIVFKCNICEKVYKSRDSLRMHKDEKHGEPRFPCSDCDLMFHSANQRWAHHNKKHKLAKK